jgi:hypothetical protein
VQSSGGQSRQLTDGPATSTVPTWSRDGKSIYFGSNRTGRFEIWRMPFAGGPAEQITRNGGYVAVEAQDGTTLYYTKTGEAGPLFVQASGRAEREVLGRVISRGFVIFDDGIYYLYADAARGVQPEIRFHEFATGRSSVIGPAASSLGLYLSVSPDRKTFLFTRYALSGSDIMLIENFR